MQEVAHRGHGSFCLIDVVGVGGFVSQLPVTHVWRRVVNDSGVGCAAHQISKVDLVQFVRIVRHLDQLPPDHLNGQLVAVFERLDGGSPKLFAQPGVFSRQIGMKIVEALLELD